MGQDKALTCARREFGDELTWGIEDCRHLSARLEIDPLTAGELVVRVPPKLMAPTRASARTRGNSNPIDALAVARAVLREPDLPVAAHGEHSRELKLLVDRREDLLGERTRMINRFRWHVHRIDPPVDPELKALRSITNRKNLGEWLAPLAGIDAEIARDVLGDIERITPVVDELERRVGRIVEEVAPALVVMPGCGLLTAAKIVGETAGVSRFRSEACFAHHAGVALIPVWWGNLAGRVRMTRTGNRQLNAALHRIAVTQIRLDGPGPDYYQKRLAAGDSKTEALRCLKRRLARIVFNHLKTDTASSPGTFLPAAA